jgi:hypothetical protein
MPSTIPNFFRVRQTFERPQVTDIPRSIQDAIEQSGLSKRVTPGQSVAITVGSRGIANIALITKSIVKSILALQAKPFIVPAMGSHGGATAEGQTQVLAELGITQESMGCEIRSSMKTVEVCQAVEGFPIHFDSNAFNADHVLVVNRIKPHTRFVGPVESGLMKMMLIGLGKHQGAIVYHRVIQNYTFDQIVRSVAREVIQRCRIVAGIAILENGYEETAKIVGMPASQIDSVEPQLLDEVRRLLPKLPFDHAELLIIDEIGKNISGTGMDTNVIGRKSNDRAAIGDELPRIHHIYVRSLSKQTQGNGSGIGIAEMCHERVLKQLDLQKTRINSITAGHISAAAIPASFNSDREALLTAIAMGGWGDAKNYPALWIPNTLKLEEIVCSEYYLELAQRTPNLEVLSAPEPLCWDTSGDLIARNPGHLDN